MYVIIYLVTSQKKKIKIFLKFSKILEVITIQNKNTSRQKFVIDFTKYHN